MVRGLLFRGADLDNGGVLALDLIGCKNILAKAFAIYPIERLSRHYKNYIRTNSQKLEEAVIRGTS